jgi:hypothetical protein
VSIFTDTLGILQDRWAEELVDSCVLKELTGQSFNSTTGVYVDTYNTSYSGACLVRPARSSAVQAGQQQAEIRMYEVFVPYTVTDAEPDYLVDVTSSDGYLTGRQLVVRNVRGDSYTAIRQLDCEDVQNA